MSRSRSDRAGAPRSLHSRLRLTLACVGAAFALLGPEQASAQTPAGDRIVRVEQARGGIEIEIAAAQPLPVRAMPIELHVGTAVFRRSLHPEGDMQRIVFFLTRGEAAALRPRDRVWMSVGASEQSAQRWELGTWTPPAP
jgi:hypothetical protein